MIVRFHSSIVVDEVNESLAWTDLIRTRRLVHYRANDRTVLKNLELESRATADGRDGSWYH